MTYNFRERKRMVAVSRERISTTLGELFYTTLGESSILVAVCATNGFEWVGVGVWHP
jgi:hypothetical protein